jgi:CBS domain-containing protein
MPTTIRDIMTSDPIRVPTTESVRSVAQQMRDGDVGAVIVEEDGELWGLISDRDLVTRVVAEGTDPDTVTVSDVQTTELTTVGPDDDLERAIELMREHAVRRLPVVEEGMTVGIVALGDLAVDRDPGSVLGQISAAQPDD